MHGRLSAVFHDESPLYAGIPQGFEAVRYHSLCVAQPLPACLRGHGLDRRRRRDGRRAPRAAAVGRPVPPGVDLHQRRAPARPELPRPDRAGQRRGARATGAPIERPLGRRRRRADAAGRGPARPRSLGLEVRRLERLLRPRARLLPSLRRASRTPSGWTAARRPTTARGSPSWARRRPAELGRDLRRRPPARCGSRGRRRPRSAASRSSTTSIASCAGSAASADDLPFDLTCGFVGYLGYELKADCEGDLAASLGAARRRVRLRRPAGRVRPRRADRPMSLCLTDAAGAAAGERWVEEMSRPLDGRAAAARARPADPDDARRRAGRVPPQPVARRRYLDDIRPLQGLPHARARPTRSA